MTFEELLIALDQHSDVISTETKAGHNTNLRVGLLGKKISDILRLIGNADAKFLSRVTPDTAEGLIRFIQGIEVGDFKSGLLGSGAALKNINDTTSLEVDQLLVRQRAEFFSVLIHEAKSVGGQMIISAANMLCIKVEDTTDFYRCYFDGKGGEVINLFENTDFARCQVFTGTRQKFYWRKIISVGNDYIDLSKTDAAINSNIPEVGDSIFQLGSTNIDRQGAMILSTVGADAPSFIQYAGISTYDLTGKETTKFSRLGNVIQGKTVFTSSGQNIEDWTADADIRIQAAIDKRSLRIEKYYSPGYDTYREGQETYNATLALKIFYDDEDVTSTININRFVWSRISENTAGDPTWNELHANAGASIDITLADLAGDTSFVVQFYDTATNQTFTETF